MAHRIGTDRAGSAAWRCALGALVLGAMGACGGSGSGGGGGPPPGSGAMTATIDGQAFASDAQRATATVSASAPGAYVLIGSKVASASDYVTVSVTLYNLAATGTYPLGVTGVVFGGVGSVTQQSGATFGTWLTPLSGASGTVTVSTLTSSRIAGTFSFTAAASLDPTSIKSVTNGSFDLPVTGSAGTLPANAGNSMTARINGAQWTAAAVAGVGYSSGTLTFGGLTTAGNPTYNVNFIIGSVTGPATYPYSTTGVTRRLMVTSSTQVWSSQFTGATGAVVVTDLTTARVKGSFTATLPPASGTGAPLTIDNGSFNLGLP